MDLKTMFPNLNVMWTRWSDYEVVQSHKRHYLVPMPGATSLTYNCAEQPEALVADALELGRRLRLGAPIKNACVPLLQSVTGFWAEMPSVAP